MLRRAAALLQAGRAAEAEALAAPLVEASPRDADALHVLAIAVHLQRRPERAVPLLVRATELRPGDATLWNSLGNARRLAGDASGAERCFQRSLELDPEAAATWYNLGHLRQLRGEPGAAVAPLRRAVELAPEGFDAALALGTALLRSGAGDEAAEAEAAEWFEAAHHLAPERPEPLNNLAAVHAARGDTEAALAAFRRAVTLDPGHLHANVNLGEIHGGRGEVGQAAEAYRRASRHGGSGGSRLRLNLALTLLQAGCFGEAWEAYESRFTATGPPRHPTWNMPRWDGSPLDGRRLLITDEQGLGDMIQFCRYATLVAEAGGEPWVEARRPVAPLLATCPGVAGVVPSRYDPDTDTDTDSDASPEDGGVAAEGADPSRFDLHIPVLSLPGVFDTDLATIPAGVPYLSPAAEPRPAARELLRATAGDARRVGLVWAGSPQNPGDEARSCGLAAMAPLAEVPGVRLYNLLHGERGRDVEDHPELGLVDLAPHLGDFHETAAVVRELDLVITVDTSMAHLAGALGQPVWTLLSFVPDWRWLMDRDDSPWYPTMRLFRQRAAGDWEGLMERVAVALEESAGDPTR